jgi:hypothetical protein
MSNALKSTKALDPMNRVNMTDQGSRPEELWTGEY